jgi:methyltransferase (TIGR00027 family)
MTHEQGISKTAIWVAAARAIGAREPDPAVRNPDHLAEALLGDPALLDREIPIVEFLAGSYAAAMQEIEVAGTVRAMAERTRFIDRALERALADGATQCLILGAGLDSRACRFAAPLAHARVYEVDRPRTSAFKQARVAAALGGAPANLTYVATDLQRETLPGALARHGYDPSRRTFAIMEGLTMYVPEEALRETFGYLATHAPGSSVVFDFATRAMVDGLGKVDLGKVPPASRPPIERFMNMIRHEPWLFGIALGGEQEFLASVGLRLRELLTVGSEESVRRHLTRADGSTLGAEAQARSDALARLVQERMVANMDPAQREKAAAAMREQARQNAYRIAEAVVGN